MTVELLRVRGFTITLNTDKKTLNFFGTTENYSYKDGVFTANLTGVKRIL